MDRSSILRTCLIVYQILVGVTLIIFALLYATKTGTVKHESETIAGNNTNFTTVDFDRSALWVKHVFPFAIGENLQHIMVAFNLTRKLVISVLLILLFVLEICFRNLYLGAGGVTKLQVVVTCMLTIAAVCANYFCLYSVKLLTTEESQTFLWENVKLIMKVYAFRLIMNRAFTSHEQNIKDPLSSAGSAAKATWRKKGQYADCIFHETKSLLLMPFSAWLIALTFHILLSETNNYSPHDNNSILPDLHAAMPGSSLVKLCMVILLEVDHVLLLSAVMELKWVAGIIFFITVFCTQLYDVFKANRGVFYKNQNKQLLCVCVKIMTCVLTPWMTRILIGIQHYFLWDIIGGTASSLFWFAQLYLHLFCIVARLRLFSHLIHFGVVSSLKGLLGSNEENTSCEFELHEYMMNCEV